MAVTWGTPTPVTTRVVQMLPGPDPDLHRVDPAPHQLTRTGLGGDVPGDQLHVGERLPQLIHGGEHAFAVTVGRVHHDHVHARADQASAPAPTASAPPPTAAATRSRPC